MPVITPAYVGGELKPEVAATMRQGSLFIQSGGNNACLAVGSGNPQPDRQHGIRTCLVPRLPHQGLQVSQALKDPTHLKGEKPPRRQGNELSNPAIAHSGKPGWAKSIITSKFGGTHLDREELPCADQCSPP